MCTKLASSVLLALALASLGCGCGSTPITPAPCGAGDVCPPGYECVDGHCYVIPDGQPDLGAETCNGIDDDQDGETDEDFNVGDACDGIGECGAGTIECADPTTTRCSTHPGGTQYPSPSPVEQCDSLDNDCDGQTDNGFGIGDACEGIGECGAGTFECADPTTTRCSTDPGGTQYPSPSPVEQCDSLDNDCDDLTDEDFPSKGTPCDYVGPEDLDTCEDDEFACNPAQTGTECQDVSDGDGDGHAACDGGACGVAERCDCDDLDATLYPGAELVVDASTEALWHLNGDAADAGPNAYNGTVSSPASVPGLFGSAYDFQPALGSNQITIPDPVLSVGPLVVELWFKTVCSGDCGYLISNHDTGTGGFFLTIAASRVRFGFGQGGIRITSDVTIDDGAWHHVVAVFDGANAELYLDGSLSAGPTPGVLTATTLDLKIGQASDANITAFGGIIDEVRISSATRAAADIQKYWECVNPCFPEICDGQDNDCDGTTDEDFPDLGSACDPPGECGPSVKVCTPNRTATCCASASGCASDESQPETCDALDNDCDGSTDDDGTLCGSVCDVANVQVLDDTVGTPAPAPFYAYWGTSVAIGDDGLPVIAYTDVANDDLKVAHCGDAGCCAGNVTRTVVDSTNEVGHYPALTISGGVPLIAHRDATNGDLRVASCSDDECSSPCGSGTTCTTMDAGGDDTGVFPSVAIRSGGLPIVIHDNATVKDQLVVRCDDTACSNPCGVGATTCDVLASNGGSFSDIAIGADLNPVVSYPASELSSNDPLWVAKCVDQDCNATCGNGATCTQLDPNGGRSSSIAIPSDDMPVISYRLGLTPGSPDVRVCKCSSSACSSATCVTIEVGGPTIEEVNTYTSIALASTDGLPMISYYLNGALKVAKCTLPDCSDTLNNTLTTIDATADVGMMSSMVIDPDGFPVISYFDFDNGTLKVARCTREDCSP